MIWKWPKLQLPDINIIKNFPKGVSYVQYDSESGKILNIVGKALWFWEV